MRPDGEDTFRIDALECSRWDRERFEEWSRGGLHCVHVTLAIWEDARDTLRVVGQWEQLFREHANLIIPARSTADIRHAKATGRTAVLLGLQNTSPFEDDLDLVGGFYAAGVRIAQLTYNVRNLVGGGCWEQPDPGISSHFGRNVIAEMNRLGMLVDLSHCGERTCLEAIELSDVPVAITHGNPAEFVGPDAELAARNRSSRVLRKLAENGGVVGLSMYPRLAAGGTESTLADFCEMVAWTIDLIGVDHVGIGTDLYLGHQPDILRWWRMGRWSRAPAIPLSGPVTFPDWMQSPADFDNIAFGLQQRGLREDQIDQVLGGNWMRLLERVIDQTLTSENDLTATGRH